VSTGIVRSGDIAPLGTLPRGGVAAVGRRSPTAIAVLRVGVVVGIGLVLCLGGEHAPEPSAPRVRETQQLVLAAAAASGRFGSMGRAGAPVTSAVPTVRELVGQRFVIAMSGTSPSAALLARVRRGEIGGVILFGSNVVSPVQLHRLTSTLQRAARGAGRPPLLVATDQEGGRVRRLPWAGPTASAVDLGRLGTSRIRAEAAASGEALRRAGVNVDLAPVGDLPGPRSFMALEQRTFATTTRQVAEATVAFAQGLATARVAAAVKHFPGIGRAKRNTDRAAVEIGATRMEIIRRDLPAFRSAIDAGVPIVMISNATYPALDPKPAPWSPAVQSLLRRELGFTGVTVSDALDGAAATRRRSLPAVAALAAEAGVDLLLLTGSEASSAAAFERVAGIAEKGELSAGALQASYGRILELKATYG
jgi:beta-N-acetylhexosaminidase